MTQTNGRSQTAARADWTDFAHTGPGTLAGRYLRLFWHPGFRSQDLKPGKAMPIRVLSEDLTLYRGETGTAHILAFRCAHRGTQLSTGWIEGDNLRCRYHGWAYDGSGQCVQQPAEPEPFCEKVRIGSYPTQEYLGLIFVYMGDGEVPPMPRYPEAEGDGEYEVSLHYRGCNYFNNMENSLDEIHVHFTHWNRRVPLLEQDLPEVSGEETDYGIIRYGKRSDGTRTVHFHMPNAHHLGGGPGGQSIHWRVPVDDGNHMIPTSTFVPAGSERRRRGEESENEDPFAASKEIADIGAAIRAGKLTIEELDVDRQYIPITDDVTQVGQGIIPDRDVERLGRSDAVIVLLRKIWERELRALAEGRPLKEWNHPAELLISGAPPR